MVFSCLFYSYIWIYFLSQEMPHGIWFPCTVYHVEPMLSAQSRLLWTNATANRIRFAARRYHIDLQRKFSFTYVFCHLKSESGWDIIINHIDSSLWNPFYLYNLNSGKKKDVVQNCTYLNRSILYAIMSQIECKWFIPNWICHIGWFNGSGFLFLYAFSIQY